MKMPARAPRYFRLIFWFIPGITAGLVLFFHNPAESQFYPVCLFHKLTGWHCPGCGSLRALFHLAHGHWATAFHFNPLLMLFLPLLVWVILRQLWKEIFAKELAPIFTRPFWGWLALGLIVSFGVLRNLPFSPFIWLAP